MPASEPYVSPRDENRSTYTENRSDAAIQITVATTAPQDSHWTRAGSRSGAVR